MERMMKFSIRLMVGMCIVAIGAGIVGIILFIVDWSKQGTPDFSLAAIPCISLAILTGFTVVYDNLSLPYSRKHE